MERQEVLRQLAAGDLTVDEADDLLDDDPAPFAPRAPKAPKAPKAPRAPRPPGRSRVDEVIALAAHGVTADDVRAFKEAGLSDLTHEEVIAFATHGVDADFICRLRDAGLGQAFTPAEIVAMAVHGVEPEDARELLSLLSDD